MPKTHCTSICLTDDLWDALKAIQKAQAQDSLADCIWTLVQRHSKTLAPQQEKRRRSVRLPYEERLALDLLLNKLKTGQSELIAHCIAEELKNA